MTDWDWGTIAPIVLSLFAVGISWRGYRLNKQKAKREESDRQESIRASQMATMTAHVLHREGLELDVVNEGPGPAVLQSVEAPDHPDLFMGSPTFGDHLLKGGKRVLLVALSQAIPREVTIRITWTDIRGEQSRDQTLDF